MMFYFLLSHFYCVAYLCYKPLENVGKCPAEYKELHNIVEINKFYHFDKQINKIYLANNYESPLDLEIRFYNNSNLTVIGNPDSHLKIKWNNGGPNTNPNELIIRGITLTSYGEKNNDFGNSLELSQLTHINNGIEILICSNLVTDMISLNGVHLIKTEQFTSKDSSIEPLCNVNITDAKKVNFKYQDIKMNISVTNKRTKLIFSNTRIKISQHNSLNLGAINSTIALNFTNLENNKKYINFQLNNSIMDIYDINIHKNHFFELGTYGDTTIKTHLFNLPANIEKKENCNLLIESELEQIMLHGLKINDGGSINLTSIKTLNAEYVSVLGNCPLKSINISTPTLTLSSNHELFTLANSTVSISSGLHIKGGKFYIGALKTLKQIRIRAYFEFGIVPCCVANNFVFENSLHYYLIYSSNNLIENIPLKDYLNIKSPIFTGKMNQSPTVYLKVELPNVPNGEEYFRVLNDLDNCSIILYKIPEIKICALCFSEDKSKCKNTQWLNLSNFDSWTSFLRNETDIINITLTQSLLSKMALNLPALRQPVHIYVQSDKRAAYAYPSFKFVIKNGMEKFVRSISLSYLSVDIRTEGTGSIYVDKFVFGPKIFFNSGVLNRIDFSGVRTVEVDATLIGMIPLERMKNIQVMLYNETKIMYHERRITLSGSSWESSVIVVDNIEPIFVAPENSVTTLSCYANSLYYPPIHIKCYGKHMSLVVDNSWEWINTTAAIVSATVCLVNLYGLAIPIEFHNSEQIVLSRDPALKDRIVINGIVLDSFTTAVSFKDSAGKYEFSKIVSTGDCNLKSDQSYSYDSQLRVDTLELNKRSQLFLQNVNVRRLIEVNAETKLTTQDVDISDARLTSTFRIGDTCGTVKDNEGRYKATFPRHFTVNVNGSLPNASIPYDCLLVTPRSRSTISIWKNLVEVTPSYLDLGGTSVVGSPYETAQNLYIKFSPPETAIEDQRTVVYATISIICAVAVVFAVAAFVLTRKRIREKELYDCLQSGIAD